MSRAARLAGVALVVACVAGGYASAAPSLDRQVYAIAKELMCPVCAGQTVAESGSALAVQMRQIIRERLQRGQTKDEIIAYFVSQFGESVLAIPPRRGGGLVIWLAPPTVLVAGLALLQRFVRRHRGAVTPSAPPPTAQEAEQIARELREMD